ncbi:MAG TPA: hypothetical protein VHD87_12965 [Acidimicrobiales bacterium]|nr:hypothetical protein [Acidimicrobiales bacterium]
MSTHTDLTVNIHHLPEYAATLDLIDRLAELRLVADPDGPLVAGIASTWLGAAWPGAIDLAAAALEKAGATFYAFEAGTAESLPSVAWGAPGHQTFSCYATLDGDPLIPLSTFEALATVTGNGGAVNTGAAVRAQVRLAQAAVSKER